MVSSQCNVRGIPLSLGFVLSSMEHIVLVDMNTCMQNWATAQLIGFISVMYIWTDNSLTIVFGVPSDVGLCHRSFLRGGTEPCHQGSCSFARDASQCAGFTPCWHSCMSAYCRVVLSLHLLKLWHQGCSMLTPCILESLVISFLCRRFPWAMPMRLDAPVGVPLGMGVWAFTAHHADWLGRACPLVWLGLARTLFPFAIRVMPILFPFCHKGYIDVPMWWVLPVHWYDWVLPAPRSLSLYHRVVSRCIALSFH